MLRHIRSNAVGYLALFVALGGTGAWAADKITSADIAKNAVRSKHIKRGNVKRSDLRSNAVNSAKVARSSLRGVDIAALAIGSRHLANGAVNAAKVAPNSLGGAAINEAALSGVNASRVNGLSVVKINSRQGDDAPPGTILNLAGLRLRASCPVPGGLTVVATTTKNNSSLYGYADYPGVDHSAFDFEGGEFDTGTSVDLTTELGDIGAPRVGGLVYEAPDGALVTVQFAGDFSGTSTCVFTGTAIGG
jgi:hypothetical protein